MNTYLTYVVNKTRDNNITTLSCCENKKIRTATGIIMILLTQFRTNMYHKALKAILQYFIYEHTPPTVAKRMH